MHRKNLLFFILICIISISNLSFAQNDIPEADPQSLMSLDLSTIKVDQLSDAQIRTYLDRIEQSGLSETEVEAALLSRGFPQSELMLARLLCALCQREACKHTDLPALCFGYLQYSCRDLLSKKCANGNKAADLGPLNP